VPLAHRPVGCGEREGAAVHAKELPFFGELAEVSPDGVFRHPELVGDGFGHDPSVTVEKVEQVVFALCSEHVFPHEIARLCMIQTTVIPMTKPLLILIAGPYRSGTGGDPALIAQNLARLEEASGPIFRRGHVPMIGEWVALPVLRTLDPETAAEGDVMYETAQRLLQHCDAVLRLPGESSGADKDVEIAQQLGLPVYRSLDEVPTASTP